MRHTFCVLVLSIFSNLLFAQQRKGYEIDGRLPGLEEGEQVTMELFYGLGFNDFTRRDSTIVKNGKFHLSGVVPDGPRTYWMVFSKHTASPVLFIDNEKITIECNDPNVLKVDYFEPLLTIEGSPSNNALRCLIPAISNYVLSINAINNCLKSIQDSIGYDKGAINALMQTKERISRNMGMFCKYALSVNYYKQFVPNLAVTQFYSLSHSSLIVDIYNGLDENAKNSFDGRDLKNKIPLCVGQILPTFALSDVSGKPVSLQDIASKSKLTIVHLWAAQSNSQKRSAAQNELRVFYKKYHDKGLNIIGLSGDTSAMEWKIRVQAEQYPWDNVLDDKGKNGIVQKEYQDKVLGDNSWPDNILIDDKGKIVAWFVSGVELQWYLEKYLG